jgi:uncharacterized protein (TIGR02687 family)
LSKHRISEAIKSLLAVQPIVFWNDADGEFAGQLDSLDLPGVEIIRLDQTPALRAKVLIDAAGKDGRWLIYAPTEEPDPVSDWLLDLRLRSKSFRADSASILLEDLGLTSLALRSHLKERAKFLKAKDRVDRLRRWTDPADGPDDIDRKMLAVLARAETPEPAAILLKVFSALASDGSVSLDGSPKPAQEMVANELDLAFWALMEREFGYKDESPSLRGLLFALLATDFVRSLRCGAPSQLAHFVITEKSKAANASVFANRWRSDMANYASYDELSALVADELHLDQLIASFSAEDLVETMTFETVEKRVAADLKARILSGHGANMDAVRSLIARRRDGHWANPLLAGANESTRAFSATCDALVAAADFFELQASHAHGFSFASPAEAFTAYTGGLFRFDQLYRSFMRAAETVEPMGWALLHELRDKIEDAYSGWFLSQLSSAWGSIIEGNGGLLATWKLDGTVNQQDFFNRMLAPAFAAGSKRVFVVISDAFRYEAAEELVRDLNGKSGVKATLDAMLGVLPSYTALGMASLLPHESLAYKANANLDVTADGMPTATLDQRSAILARFGGIAIKREELMELGRTKGREFIQPHRLIYVYHDLIDMIGDKQGSETKTFQAVKDAIRELTEVINFIVKSLNGSTVFLTADHGFLYQESGMSEADRSKLDAEPAGAIKAKKRYLLGRGLGTNQKAWSGNTSLTAGTGADADSIDFWVPKGSARFHFAGGARFVHGSAMPQEIVVPVIAVKESESEKTKIKVVEVSLLGSSNKVVTNKQRFELIQTEAVSERVLPVTLAVSLRDGEVLISDEQMVTFDSPSQLLDERKKSVILTVASGTYDRNKDYFLVVRDVKTKAEAWRVAVKVDLAFSNDF